MRSHRFAFFGAPSPSEGADDHTPDAHRVAATWSCAWFDVDGAARVSFASPREPAKKRAAMNFDWKQFYFSPDGLVNRKQ
jgi:hypothetical protein